MDDKPDPKVKELEKRLKEVDELRAEVDRFRGRTVEFRDERDKLRVQVEETLADYERVVTKFDECRGALAAVVYNLGGEPEEHGDKAWHAYLVEKAPLMSEKVQARVAVMQAAIVCWHKTTGIPLNSLRDCEKALIASISTDADEAGAGVIAGAQAGSRACSESYVKDREKPCCGMCIWRACCEAVEYLRKMKIN